MKNGKGIHRLYAADPVKADEIPWGRQTSRVSHRVSSKAAGSQQWRQSNSLFANGDCDEVRANRPIEPIAIHP